jgi:hypothetical protein
MKVVAACVDGPAEVRFGFPLAWITPGPTSLSFRIDPLALVIDFSVHLGVWWLLLRTALLMRVFSWRPRLLTAGLLATAVVVAGLYILAISTDWYVGGVTFYRIGECSEAVRHSLHLGPPGAA